MTVPQRDVPPGSPTQVIAVLGVIAAIAIAFGAIMPGVAAYRSGTFFGDTMRRRLQPEVLQRVDSFETAKAHLVTEISRLDDLIVSSTAATSSDDIARLLALRGEMANELRHMQAPVSVQPFYQHIIMYFWPLMYFCLGVLVVILRPPCADQPAIQMKHIVLLGVFLYLLNVWPLWIRNVFLSSAAAGQRVYAYSNYNIDKLSFVMQQVNFAIFSLLLALCWLQWSAYFMRRRWELDSEDSTGGLEALLNPKTLERLTHTLVHWEASLITISIGFILYSAIFWNQIIRNGDSRFLTEAAIVHGLWATTGVLMSLPFWITWRKWRSDHQQAISELLHAEPAQDAALDAKLDALRELRPVGSWNVGAFAIAVLSSFVAPALQAVFRSS